MTDQNSEGSPQSGKVLAEVLNQDCHCITLNRDKLRSSLESHLKDLGINNSALQEKLLGPASHLFSSSPVFLWKGHIEKMEKLIKAVEHLAQKDSYSQTVLDNAPAIAQQKHGPRGVFFGYDFHLGKEGPQLIEINTNAGGVLLNLYLATAQEACCQEIADFFDNPAHFKETEDELIEMFREEYQLMRPDQKLARLAIVDEDPESQFLYPEFLLFKSMFERHGIEAHIAAPEEFRLENESLMLGAAPIDLVYNRLTDFYLKRPENQCLKQAYERNLAVFTPSPHLYALYADKRNLVLLSDQNKLKKLGVDQSVLETLAESLPATSLVSEETADHLWQQRKKLFFKPATGYGSKGTYKGAKLTRKVFKQILASDYIAQTLIPPSKRQLYVNDEPCSLKLDVRCVVYRGKIQQLSSRLYLGQTTNLRTEGGGLATVFPAP